MNSVLGVLVLYKCKLVDSETFISLNKALETNNLKLDLFVYDNSHISDDSVNKQSYRSLHITYVHDKTNPGICKPYNIALQIAKAKNRKWLLLLDQDTCLTSEYIYELNNTIETKSNYVSIIPLTYSKDKIVSPTRYDFLGRMKPIRIGEAKRVVENITAINSGACVNVDFLTEIGGLNKDFPLDMLDHWLNYEINKRNEQIFVMNSKLFHNLSVSEYESLSIDRFEMILKAEKKFYLIYSKKYYKILLKIRLLLRCILFLITGRFNFMVTILRNIK